jgi:hypothetical protein
MQSITTTSELKASIKILEDKQLLQGQLIKEQFNRITESLKPVNLLKFTLNEVISSPNILTKILSTTIGVAAGFISVRVFMGSSRNLIKKLVGSLLQVGITDLIYENPETLISIGKKIFQGIFNKKDVKS